MTNLDPSYLEYPEYQAIQVFYGDRTAKRSGVPLINHINEGIVIMERRGASHEAKMAFAIHPIFQNDVDLQDSGMKLIKGIQLNATSIALAMEYRWVANNFLSEKIIEAPGSWGSIDLVPKHPLLLSCLPEVNEMLVADKVQNYKDFLRYHMATHAAAGRLDYYFRLWLKRLGISDEDYQELTEGL